MMPFDFQMKCAQVPTASYSTLNKLITGKEDAAKQLRSWALHHWQGDH